MKTLAASTTISRIVVDRTGEVRSFSSFQTDDRLTRSGACFLRFQKCPDFCLFHSLSERNGGIVPVLPISSKSQATEIQTAESRNLETYHSNIVRVRFQLQRECMFGEEFLMVGDDPVFGLWNPSKAVPLNWSEGHVWMVELDIPVAKPVQFKFILKGQKGDILWQPGPDRIFQAWATRNAIVVCEDWDRAESQKTMEEEIPNQNASSAPLSSETLEDSKVLVPNMNHDGIGSSAGESVDTVSYSNKSSTNNASNSVLNSEVGGSPYQDSNHDLNKKSRETDAILNNYEAARIKNSSSGGHKRNMGMYEGTPVLVPGLTPSKTTENEAVDDGGSGAQERDIPKIELNQDPGFLTSEGNTGRYNVEHNPLYTEIKEKFGMIKIDKAILKNHQEWGRKMLQAFLNTIRVLWHQT